MSWRASARRVADGWLRIHHRARGIPEGAILVLGHMRSGSTLLLHLLMTRPEVLGCGERNAVVRDWTDIEALARECFVYHRRPMGRLRFVADQINHDHLTPNSQLLLHPDVHPVLLVRAPEKTIGSIVRTFAPSGAWPVERAVAYYVARLGTLAAYARRLRAGGQLPRLVTYEALTSDPVDTLEPLRRALDLPGPFSAEYASQRFTGRRGDPGGVIGSGAVRADAGRPVEMPPGARAEAEAAYAAFLDAAGG